MDDALVVTQKMQHSVIPAKAGIQFFQVVEERLGSSSFNGAGFHRGDGLLALHG